jgi:hypothetical protein
MTKSDFEYLSLAIILSSIFSLLIRGNSLGLLFCEEAENNTLFTKSDPFLGCYENSSTHKVNNQNIRQPEYSSTQIFVDLVH